LFYTNEKHRLLPVHLRTLYYGFSLPINTQHLSAFYYKTECVTSRNSTAIMHFLINGLLFQKKETNNRAQLRYQCELSKGCSKIAKADHSVIHLLTEHDQSENCHNRSKTDPGFWVSVLNKGIGQKRSSHVASFLTKNLNLL
jgi:hypothetical protein